MHPILSVLAAVAAALACTGGTPGGSTPKTGPEPTPSTAPVTYALPTDMRFYSATPLSRSDLQDKTLYELSLMRIGRPSRGESGRHRWSRESIMRTRWGEPPLSADRAASVASPASRMALRAGGPG